MKESCKDYLSHIESKSFNEILFSFIDESGSKDSEIYKKVDIDRKLFSKIRCDRDYPEMNPVFALMDPLYTLSMPLRQMRAGTFDILSHIMETYFSFPVEGNPADDVSEGLMKGLIRDFRAALVSPQDLQARSNIMWTASLAENRIIKTGKSKDQLFPFMDILH